MCRGEHVRSGHHADAAADLQSAKQGERPGSCIDTVDHGNFKYGSWVWRGGICRAAVHEGHAMSNQGLGAERLRRQGSSPAVPVQFTPLQGLVSVARTLAARMGLQEMWPGPDGLESVVREKLTQVGVPE